MGKEDLQREMEKLKKQLADKDKVIQKNQKIIRGKDRKIQGLKKKIKKLGIECDELKKRLRLHDGPNTPPSKRMIRIDRPRPKPGKKRGGQPGHRSTAKRVKPDREVDHALSNCACCNSPDIQVISTRKRDTTELRKITWTETVRNTTRCYKCNICGAEFASEAPGVPRRGAYGIGVIKEAFLMYLNRMPFRMIQREFARMGLKISAAAICGMLKGVAMHDLDEPTSQILKKIRAAAILHMDETSISLNGHNVWVWTFTDPVGNNVFYAIRRSRGACVLEEILPGWRGVAVADGWRAYGMFTVQRCWAHIIREAQDVAEKNSTPSTRRMAGELGRIMDDALRMSENADPQYRRRAVWRLRRRVKMLIDGHRRNPRFGGFVTKLERALPDLFRFVTDPRIPHTNNTAERSLREIVIHRKIRGGIRSRDTMTWLGNLFTCTATWRQQGLDVMANVARYV